MLFAGNLVYIDIKNKSFTNDGLATIYFVNNTPVLYENINIESYPSCNDFFGKYTKVQHNNPAIILDIVGRPFKISTKKNWECYDIYKIQLESGEVREVFKFNLSTAPT